jgi:hypothetical protein
MKKLKSYLADPDKKTRFSENIFSKLSDQHRSIPFHPWNWNAGQMIFILKIWKLLFFFNKIIK